MYTMSDTFLEKIIRKKKSVTDKILVVVILIATLFLCFFLALFFATPGLILSLILAFIGYKLIESFNVEYEYQVTNNFLDIDKIINQKKRKRLYSGDCKEFELVAKLNGPKFNSSYNNIRQKINAVSSKESDDIYFILTENDNGRMIIFFEPDERMLENFRKFIPSKVFI